MPSTAVRFIVYLVAGISAAVGPFLLILALASGVHTAMFVRKSIEVDGKVVNLVVVQGRRSWSYAPVFQFIGQDGQIHQQVSRVGTTPPYRIGERVKVLYLVGRPETAKIDTFGQLFLFPTVATVIGGAWTLLMGGVFFRIRGQRAAAEV